MKKLTSRTPDPSVMYPGIYRVPFSPERARTPQLRSMKTAQPKMEIIDEADNITIELTIPGFRREDFIVTMKDHQLHIHAHNIDHTVELPQNIDHDFMSAEYKNDKLLLRFLKFCNSGSCCEHFVAVY